jgi:hypothetical protein
MNTEISDEDCLKYDVVIFCDIYDLGRVMAADKFVRSQKNSKTVIMYGTQLGLFGIFVTDFG